VNFKIKREHPPDEIYGQFEWTGGIKCHGFTYYPRPGEVEPIIKPSKLFMVQRTHSLYKQPKWVREIITKLKLEGDEVNKVVVKNTPEMNKTLWEIKHIIKITPITFPYGEPKEGDKGFLNDKGQYILIKNIGAAVDDRRLEASHAFWKDENRMDADTLKKKLRDKWLTSRK